MAASATSPARQITAPSLSILPLPLSPSHFPRLSSSENTAEEYRSIEYPAILHFDSIHAVKIFPHRRNWGKRDCLVLLSSACFCGGMRGLANHCKRFFCVFIVDKSLDNMLFCLHYDIDEQEPATHEHPDNNLAASSEGRTLYARLPCPH